MSIYYCYESSAKIIDYFFFFILTYRYYIVVNSMCNVTDSIVIFFYTLVPRRRSISLIIYYLLGDKIEVYNIKHRINKNIYRNNNGRDNIIQPCKKQHTTVNLFPCAEHCLVSVCHLCCMHFWFLPVMPWNIIPTWTLDRETLCDNGRTLWSPFGQDPRRNVFVIHYQITPVIIETNIWGDANENYKRV